MEQEKNKCVCKNIPKSMMIEECEIYTSNFSDFIKAVTPNIKQAKGTLIVMGTGGCKDND